METRNARAFAWSLGLVICSAAVPKTAVAQDFCNVTAQLEGGGAYQGLGVHQDANLLFLGTVIGVDYKVSPSVNAFAKGAVVHQCQDWGIQLDAALYDSWASTTGVTFPVNTSIESPQGHVGGAWFYRAENIGRAGVAGSYIFNSTRVTLPDFGNAMLIDYETGLYRIGGFAQYEGNEKFMLSAGAFYVGGNTMIGSPLAGLPSSLLATHSGFEGTLSATYYATSNLGFKLRGDAQWDSQDFGTAALFYPATHSTINGYAVTAEAEYLVPNTALSVTVGGRYAQRAWYVPPETFLGLASATVTSNDLQGYMSLKISFGGPMPSSLRERDKAGAYDNTSVMKESLPGFFSNYTNAFVSF